MRWVVLWFALAALMAGLLVWQRAGLTTVILCFIAWVGGVVSATTLMKIRGERDRA